MPADKEGYVAQLPAPVLEAPIAETPKPVYKYLGGHKKKYLIVTHYPQADFIDAPHLLALESTLKRLGYEMDDVAIFNLATHGDAVFHEVTAFFTPAKLLLLGKRALPAGLPPPPLNKIDQNAGYPVLFTFSFDEMMGNNEYKKLFWEQIKLL